MAAACQFLVLINLWACLHTSSSCVFLGFLAGPLPSRLPLRIHYGILLLNILTTSPTHCNLLTCMYVTRSVSVHNLYSVPYFSEAINVYWCKNYPENFSVTRTDHLCSTLTNIHVSLPYKTVGQCIVNINPVCTPDIFILSII